MQARGSASQVLLDFETTYGADPETPAAISVPYHFPVDLKQIRPLKPSTVHRLNRNPAMPFYDNRDVKGSLSVPVDQNYLGYWLRALLGAPSTSGAGPYSHIFKPATSIESLVLEVGHTAINQFFKFNGCKVGQMDMDFGGGGNELMAKLSISGAKETPGVTAYDASPTTLALTKFANRMLTFTEAGAAFALIKSGSLSIGNELDEDSFPPAGDTRFDLPEGDVLVNGNFSCFFQDRVLYDKAAAGTESAFKVILTSGLYSLTFEFQEVLYSVETPTVVKGGVYADFKFQGYYENGAGAAAVIVTLVNAHASYA